MLIPFERQKALISDYLVCVALLVYHVILQKSNIFQQIFFKLFLARISSLEPPFL